MKIKVEVDVSDLFVESDEDGYVDLDKEVKNEISGIVVRTLADSVSNATIDYLTAQSKTAIEEQLESLISKHIGELLLAGKIKPKVYGLEPDEEFELLEYIISRFTDHSAFRAINQHISNVAQEHAAEMKKQYNAQFAMRVVDGLNKQGLLADDVVNLLLNGEEKT